MPRRLFFDWSSPLVPALTEWLLADNKTSALQGVGIAPDLSGTVVVVPTAAAGRRLRESLAQAVGETGLLAPHVITPEILISWGLPSGAKLAGKGEQIPAWAAVLMKLDLTSWRELFPVDPVNQDHAWAMQAAGDLLKLRRTLEEGCRTLRMAAADLGPNHPEAGRWHALGRLEEAAVSLLKRGGWQDPTLSRLAAVESVQLPEGVVRVIVAAVPDSVALVRKALQYLDRQTGVEVLTAIHAPQALDDSFDYWGRPLPSTWTKREIHLPGGTSSIALLQRPDEEAGALIRALQSGDLPPGDVVIGSADPEVSAPLQRRAGAAGLEVYDPEGKPLLEHEVSWLMRTLTQLMHNGDWTAAGHLLRIPDVLAQVCKATGVGSKSALLEEWDAFQADRFPQSLHQAAPLAKDWAARKSHHHSTSAGEARNSRRRVLPAVVEWLELLRHGFDRVALQESVDRFLESIYGQRKFADGVQQQLFVSAVQFWQEAIDSVENGCAAFLPSLPPAARLELAASLVHEARLYAPHEASAHALNGWLELPWQDAPHLVIAGLNEGLVPESLHGDAWLPDSVRGALELKTNETRLARDSYLLSAMIESRRELGSIQLLAARQTTAGDPLKPGRLLFRCPPEELPARALYLFPGNSAKGPRQAAVPPWQRAWPLSVPPPPDNAPVFTRMSVSAFSDYLKCPFRFYLKHVLKMQEYDPGAAEMDPRAFGNVFHEIVQMLHLDKSLRDSSDADVLTQFLLDSLEQFVARNYGTQLTIPVLLQLDTLRQSLKRVAELHAEQRAAGWRFKEVELDFPRLPGTDQPIQISGVEIRGRADLIEYHPEKGLRILDYKTSSKASSPQAAHLIKQKAEPNGPDWRYTTCNGTLHEWKNLQLPLYASIMSQHYGEPVAAGYYSFPRTVSESRLEMWEDLNDTILSDAVKCAEGVIACIQARIFWPPAKVAKFDDYKSLVFGDFASSFDISAMQQRIAGDGGVKLNLSSV